MKFGELITKFRHPSVDYNVLKDDIADSATFVKALTAEITRVDGIYEILYVAYNAAAQQLVGSAEATPNRLYSLTNEVHQLFEFAVLNLVAIEKIMKKHDKAHKAGPKGPTIRTYVEQETFMYSHMVQSPLYRWLPDLYVGAASKFESTHYCNVCVSQVPYAMQLDCSHVLCLRCASNMRKHFFTQCPTCRKECNLSPIYAKAKELLGQAPNPSFSLLQLEAPVDPQHQHQHAQGKCADSGSGAFASLLATKQQAFGMLPDLGLDGGCCDGGGAATESSAATSAFTPLFGNLLDSHSSCGSSSCGSSVSCTQRLSLLPHARYPGCRSAVDRGGGGGGGGRNVGVGVGVGVRSVPANTIFNADSPLDLEMSDGSGASSNSNDGGGNSNRGIANDFWLELGLDLSSMAGGAQRSGRGSLSGGGGGAAAQPGGLIDLDSVFPVPPFGTGHSGGGGGGALSAEAEGSLLDLIANVNSGSSSSSSSNSAHACGGARGNAGGRMDRRKSSTPDHRRPLTASADEGDDDGDDDDEEEGAAHSGSASSPDRQVPGLTGTLATIFTRNALRSGPSEWRKILAGAASCMTTEDNKVIQELRRKAMSCVYAERARKKRLGKLKDVTGRVGKLDRRNKALEDENKKLRRELAELKAHIRRSNGMSGHAF